MITIMKLEDKEDYGRQQEFHELSECQEHSTIPI